MQLNNNYSLDVLYVCECRCHSYPPLPYPRVVIVCMGEHKAGRGGYQGRGSALDLSMWIALNNIMAVEMGSEAFVS